MLVFDYLWAYVTHASIWSLLAIFLVGAMIERWRPAEPVQTAGDAWLNVAYALFTSFLGFALAPLLAIIATAMIAACGGGWIALPGEGWGLLGAAALYIFVVDFLEYAFHRSQHAWPPLWAMHSLHHSDRAVNVTTSARNFWLEPLLKAAFIYPLAAILFKVPPAVLTIYGLTTVIHVSNHLNLGVSFPRLWRVVNTPQYHRIHHSILPEHRERNFAAYFPVFDLLFGTYHCPAPGEFPATGLDTGEAPADFPAAVSWPLRRRRLGDAASPTG